jgi:predicted DNA-binding transcriptional regulator AlpA
MILTVAEYAKKIGKSRQRIYFLIRNGKFPKEKIVIETKNIIKIKED